MHRPTAAWGTGLFLVCVPGIVAGALPLWIANTGSDPRWPHGLASVIGGWACSRGNLWAGGFLRAIRARRSRHPRAPIAPTEVLVVRGIYRWVRNPMYLAVLLVSGVP